MSGEQTPCHPLAPPPWECDWTPSRQRASKRPCDQSRAPRLFAATALRAAAARRYHSRASSASAARGAGAWGRTPARHQRPRERAASVQRQEAPRASGHPPAVLQQVCEPHRRVAVPGLRRPPAAGTGRGWARIFISLSRGGGADDAASGGARCRARPAPEERRGGGVLPPGERLRPQLERGGDVPGLGPAQERGVRGAAVGAGGGQIGRAHV